MVHADFMTHRVFSRNGRSSRAVPVATLLKEEPYVPHFMKNQPGMVAMEEMEPADYLAACRVWEEMAQAVKDGVQTLNALGVHKQWANRPLEWFGYIDVLVTSTDWANFFALRDEAGAQPEIQDLAKAMKVALDTSEPEYCPHGFWHMPYIDMAVDYDVAEEWLINESGKPWDMGGKPHRNEVWELLRKIAVARCARLTIRPFDGDASIKKELDRYEKLMVSQPVHASPAEHIATPDRWCEEENFHSYSWCGWEMPEMHGNFHGWKQYRKMIPNEAVFDNHSF